MSVSTLEIQGYLTGITYPVDKTELIARARAEGADDAVLDLLDSISDREYADSPDVMNELEGMELL